jgi:hypothetical protein
MLAKINTSKVQARFGVSLLHPFLIIQGYDQNYMKYIQPKYSLYLIPFLCNFCKLDEDYSHYFITCASLKEFSTKFQNLIKGFGIETKITLKHIVLGYTIDDTNYLALIFFITVVGFSIYKSYYISEQKTKYINVYRIFV